MNSASSHSEPQMGGTVAKGARASVVFCMSLYNSSLRQSVSRSPTERRRGSAASTSVGKRPGPRESLDSGFCRKDTATTNKAVRAPARMLYAAGVCLALLGSSRAIWAQTVALSTTTVVDKLGNRYSVASIVESGNSFIQIVKLSPRRSLLWAKNFAVSPVSIAASIALGNNGNVYVGGSDLLSAEAFLLQYNSAGVFISSRTVPEQGQSYEPLLSGMVFDSRSAHLYAAETFLNPARAGRSSVLAMDYDSNLNLIKTQEVSESPDVSDESGWVAVDTAGYVYVGVEQFQTSVSTPGYEIIRFSPGLAQLVSKTPSPPFDPALFIQLVYVSGDGQSGFPGAQLPIPLAVQALDYSGEPLGPGENMGFDITSTPPGATGTSLSNYDPLTDSNSVASTFMTLGNELGNYQVQVYGGCQATCFPITPVVFNETAIQAQPFLSLSTGDAQIGFVNQTLPEPLSVISTTTAGPAQGVPVNFSISTATPAGILSVSSATTNSSGLAETLLTLSSVPVDNYVNATCPSCQAPATVSFHECAKLNVPYFNQGDTTPWANDTYDDTSSTMGAKGCAVSSLAMLAQFYGVTTGVDGKPVNPGNLNAWLENPANGGYDYYGGVYWSKIFDYTNGSVDTDGKIYNTPLAPINPGTYTQAQLQDFIQQDLSQGLPVIAFVKNPTTRHPHFIVLASVCGLPTVVYSVDDPGNSGFSAWDSKGYVLYGIRRFFKP